MDWLQVIRDAFLQIPGWLLTSSLGFAAALFLRWLATLVFRLTPTRVLLDFKKPEDIHIVIGTPWNIIPGTKELNRYGGMPIFGFGPLHAYHEIMQILSTAYPKSNAIPLETSRTFPHSEVRGNLILIGFPLGNSITEMVMNDLNLPLIFDQHSIIEKSTGQVKFQAIVKDNKVSIDYGCIIRARNPYAHNSTVLIFAGCETFGVKAAAEFLSVENLHKLRGMRWPRGRFLALLCKLTSRLTGSEYYQVIVSTQVRDLVTSEPELVQHFSLE